MNNQNTLAVTHNSDDKCLLSFTYLPSQQDGVNEVVVPLELLSQSAHFVEHWTDNSPTKVEKTSAMTQISSPNHLVIMVQSAEPNLAQLVKKVYHQAYQASEQHGFPHLLRTWNYIHNINGKEDGLERYQSFCVARHEALEQCNLLQKASPAATAIGSVNGMNCFVFLFSRMPGQVIENKRQVSAWHYPLKYAPKQPRFSRAMQMEGLLMCSGTASVVGHETVHIGDIKGQFSECMENVNQLLKSSKQNYEINAGIYRFYLRDKSCTSLLETLILQQGIEKYIILHGDICRENLIIECEVVFQT